MSEAETGEIETSPTRATLKRLPLEGQALVDFVSKLVAQGYQPMAIARKARIPVVQATKLRREIFERGWQSVLGDLDSDEKKQLKSDLRNNLLNALDDVKDEVRGSRKQGKVSTRAHTRTVGITKLLMAMDGFNAPTLSASLNLDARISPEQQQALINDAEYRRHALAMEQREREIAAQWTSDVAGPVRGSGERRSVGL